MKTTYYLIRERLVGKREYESDGFTDYLFLDGRWAFDGSLTILKYLMGFDETEPEDSPYAVGNSDIMDEIWEIPEEDAMKIITLQLFGFLQSKWKEDFVGKKEEWDKNPRWPAKYVETRFEINGLNLVLHASDLPFEPGPWYEGFFESIQRYIEDDIIAYGGVITGSYGFLD